MTFRQVPRLIPSPLLRDYLHEFTWSAWRPQFVVLHNTAIPTLGQYANPATSHLRRMENMVAYWKGMHWHAGPHWVVAPDGVYETGNPIEDGVHCSCWNHKSFGIEMIGDYSKEAFDAGPGAIVRHNAVTLLAAIHLRFGWDPGHFVEGVSGLHFHQMCVHDHHDCPGKGVDRTDVVRRVKDAMAGKPDDDVPAQVAMKR